MTGTQRRHPTTYGWRAKIGVIVPPTNTVNEAEWNIMAPDGVTIHSTRMPLHADHASVAGKQALYDDIEKATSDLAQAGVDVVAYGCTAGSMATPMTELADFMTEIAGVPCVTTAASIVTALKSLGVGKVALATPYGDKLNNHEKKFLANVEIETVNMAGLGIGAGGPHEYPKIAKTPPETIHDHVVSADRPEADCMLISCTDFPVMNMISDFEDELGKPVVTSNQATFWAALRAAGIEDRLDKYGTLLKEY